MARGASNGKVTAGELALAELEEMGLRHLVTNDPADVDPRGWLNAWDISNLDIPDERTLPILGRPGMILEGGTNLLYSYPKVGKTELLTQMAAEWCDAGARVRYITEEPFGNWRKRLAAHHVTSTNLEFYYGWGCDVSHILCLIGSEDYDVLILDTLRNTVGFIEADGDKDVARVLHPLLAACAGRTCVCGYHARKMPGEGGRDISGHHSLYGAFDRALQLVPVEGKDNQRKLVASGRCMYDGDASLVYQQDEPGMLRALDGAAVLERVKVPKAKKVKPARYCPQCRDEFTPERSTAKFCGDACRAAFHRQTRESVSENG